MKVMKLSFLALQYNFLVTIGKKTYHETRIFIYLCIVYLSFAHTGKEKNFCFSRQLSSFCFALLYLQGRRYPQSNGLKPCLKL